MGTRQGLVYVRMENQNNPFWSAENLLRAVPTIVTAHTFCAPRDTRVSYGWCLLVQEYFCVV